MTTEESELTFVRCPSCRSLVPAVATRCRMCGHQFAKGEAESQQDDSSQPKSRVRQRTISATKDEVEEIKRQILGGEGAAAEHGAGAESDEEHAEDRDDGRIRIGKTPPPDATRKDADTSRGKSSRSVRVVDEDDDVFDDDIDTTYLSKAVDDEKPAESSSKKPSLVIRSSELAQNAAEAAKNEPPKRNVDWSTDEDELHPDEEPDDDDDDSSDDAPGALGSDAPGAPAGERKRKRRRKKKKGGQGQQAFGGDAGPSAAPQHGDGPAGNAQVGGSPHAAPRPAESRSTEPVAPEARAPESRPAEDRAAVRFDLGKRTNEPGQSGGPNIGFQSSSRPAETPPEAPVAPAGQVLTAVQSKVEEQREAPSSRGNSMSQAEHFVHGGSSARSGDSQASAGSHAGSEAEGTIVGWLIHFGGDARGQAMELRSGKFFIGRQKLRNGDLVVADSSISTPHCLITAGAGEGLSLQDLMSEQGTFVKRARGDSYQRLDQVTFIEHGDWVRFGAYEVLVCLVPYARRRN